MRSSHEPIPAPLQDLLQGIPPSSFYKSDQLHDAYRTMMTMLDDVNAWEGTTFVNDAVTYYLQTLSIACHEILGYVHISLASDVYERLNDNKQPEWCRCMYDIYNTDLHVNDEDLVRVLQDWIHCSVTPSDVEQHLKESKRMDLWDRLDHTAVPIRDDNDDDDDDPEYTLSQYADGSERSIEPTVEMSDLSTAEILVPDMPTRDLFYLLVNKLETWMTQPRINATTYYPTVFLAVEALKRIDGVTDEDLRLGLLISSSCLLRRDATWIFRLLDQRGVVQRDDLYHILHVYCNDYRQPLGINFAISLLKYCEKQSETNVYIRRPDPIMYRMVLKAMGNNSVYAGFGQGALNIMKYMSLREKGDDTNSEGWKSIFDDHASAVSAFVDDSQTWSSVQRADGLVRALYASPAGMRKVPSSSASLEHLVRVGQKLRMIPLPSEDTPGPLFKVLSAYKAQDSSNVQESVVAAISLFEFALEQTAAGKGTLEELSKLHFFVIIELCRGTNTFLVQEVVRLFKRVEELVDRELLSRDLVSPSVSYQILSLLAAENAPGHVNSALYILDHYVSQTKDPRLAAFQYAIQCCCAENNTVGCSKAVFLLERATRTFQRKPFRDSFFRDTLQQLELHDVEGRYAAKVYDILKIKLYPTSLDIDTRIAILVSSYRCLQRDRSSIDKVQEVVGKLAKLQELNPTHPAFASGECFQGAKTTEFVTPAESGQTASAIDILLSSNEAGDVVMAASILEQSEADGTPHGPQTYQQVIEAFIGSNNMIAATNVLRSMKQYHPNACRELESTMFDIVLSSGQGSDLQLAEYMLHWTNDGADLCDKATKMVYTYLSFGTQQAMGMAEDVLSYLGDMVGEEDEVWIELNRLVRQAGVRDEVNGY